MRGIGVPWACGSSDSLRKLDLRRESGATPAAAPRARIGTRHVPLSRARVGVGAEAAVVAELCQIGLRLWTAAPAPNSRLEVRCALNIAPCSAFQALCAGHVRVPWWSALYG